MNAAEILGGGARLVRTQPKAIAIWGGLYLVACAAMFALIWPMFSDLIAFQQQAVAAQAANLPPPGLPVGFFGIIFLIDAVLLVLLAILFAAAVRAVASGGHDTFGFIRFGMDELRLVGLGILLFIIGFVGMIVLVIAMIIILAGLALLLRSDSTGTAVALTFVAISAVYAVLIWAQVRISLAGALTVLRGRIVIREAWRATRGRFWTLFGVYLLFGVAYMAVVIVMVAIANPALFSAYASGMDPEQMQAALVQQETMMTSFGPRLIASWLIGAVITTVGVAFIFGAVATAAIGFDRDAHAESASAYD